MATVTTRKVGTGVAAIGNLLRKMEVTLDFSSTNGTSGDTIQLFSIPADSVVLAVGAEVVTAEGGTLTIDVGDGDDPDGYLDGSNGNSATHYTSLDTSVGYVGGRLYGSADTIDVLMNNTADTAVIHFWALVMDVSRRNTGDTK